MSRGGVVERGGGGCILLPFKPSAHLPRIRVAEEDGRGWRAERVCLPACLPLARISHKVRWTTMQWRKLDVRGNVAMQLRGGDVASCFRKEAFPFFSTCFVAYVRPCGVKACHHTNRPKRWLDRNAWKYEGEGYVPCIIAGVKFGHGGAQDDQARNEWITFSQGELEITLARVQW